MGKKKRIKSTSGPAGRSRSKSGVTQSEGGLAAARQYFDRFLIREEKPLLSTKIEYAIAAAIVALGAFLRFGKLGEKSFWFDELKAFYSAQNSFMEILSGKARSDLVPLADIVEHFFLLFGQNEIFARLPWAIFGTILVFATYHVGRRWFGQSVALASSFIISINAAQILHSQDARPYTLFCLLALYAAYFLWLAIEEGGIKNWIVYLGLAALLRFTHPYSNYIYVAHFSWFLYHAAPALRNPEKRKQVAISGGVIFVAMLMMTATYWDLIWLKLHRLFKGEAVRAYNLDRDFTFFHIIFNYFYFGVWSILTRFYPAYQMYIFTFLSILGTGYGLLRRRTAAAFSIFNAFIPLAIGFILVYVVLTVPRYFLFIQVFSVYLAVLGGAAIIEIIRAPFEGEKTKRTVSLASAFIMLVPLTINSGFWTKNYYNEGHHANTHKGAPREIADAVLEAYRPGDILAVFASNHMAMEVVDYYLGEKIPKSDRRYSFRDPEKRVGMLPEDRRVIAVCFHDPIGGQAIATLAKKYQVFRLKVVLASQLAILDPAERTIDARMSHPDYPASEKFVPPNGRLTFEAEEIDRIGSFVLPSEVIDGRVIFPVMHGASFRYFVVFAEPGDYRITITGDVANDAKISSVLYIDPQDKRSFDPIEPHGDVLTSGVVTAARAGLYELIFSFTGDPKPRDKVERLLRLDKVIVEKAGK